MAKISFTKLNAKTNNDIKTVEFNGQVIEVKQYLPVNDKLTVIENVINAVQVSDANGFVNPVKVQVFAALEVLYNYTNINFTEKQKETPEKLYDIVFSSGLFTAVQEAIPQEEWDELFKGLWDLIDNIYEYHNSVMGILESMSKDYSNLNLDIEALTNKLSNPDELKLVKDIINKLG